MTYPTLKGNLQNAVQTTVKGKGIAKYPASLSGADGVAVTINQGAATFTLDYPGLIDFSTIADPDSTYLAAHNAVLGYRRISVAAFVLAVAAAIDLEALADDIHAAGLVGDMFKAIYDANNDGVVDYITNALAQAGGGEGGQINLEKASGSTLSGNVAIDTILQRLRFFESGGTARGAYIDFTECGTGASSKLLHMDNVASALADLARPYVILCTGQSNVDIFRAYSWSPEPNVHVWNWRGIYNVPAQDDSDVGSGFIPMEDDVVSWGRSYANARAKRYPGRQVYLINIGWSGMAVSHWLPGTSSPDVYNAVKINVEAALAELGVDQIDELIIWQGESDALAPNFVWAGQIELVLARLRSETWFPYSTPVVFSGFSPYDDPGGPTRIQLWEDQIRAAAYADPEVRTYVSYVGTPVSFWEAAESHRHATADGYYNLGILAEAGASKAKGGRVDGRGFRIVKRRPEPRASTATPAADTELNAWLLPDKSYRIRFDLYGVAGAGGFKWSVTGPTSDVIVHEYSYALITLGSNAAWSNTYANTGYPSSISISGTGYFHVKGEMIIRGCDANAVLSIKWSQNSSNVAQTYLNEGSYIEVENIPTLQDPA